MHFGVVREKMPEERRVALPPSVVDSLVAEGHTVVVKAGAGAEAGFPDEEYRAAGANLLWAARDVAGQADVLVKVHPPMPDEVALFRPDGVMVGFLFMSTGTAAQRARFRDQRTTALALELIEEDDGSRPVLQTLSTIGGQVAIAMAARLLLVSGGGIGRLMGGVHGVPPLNVVILGAGSAGEAAARAALSRGAQVIVLDRDPRALWRIDHRLQGVATAISASTNLDRYVARADILVGAVAAHGESAPRVLRRGHIRSMRPGSLFLDMSIDAGGCSETSRPTTHAQPVYEVDGVRHVCVPNLPSEVANMASTALGDATLPYLLDLAEHGVDAAVSRDGPLRRACVYQAGKLKHLRVAAATGEPIDL